jgi:hypothetical protein
MMKSNPLGAVATVVAIGAWYSLRNQMQANNDLLAQRSV